MLELFQLINGPCLSAFFFLEFDSNAWFLAWMVEEGKSIKVQFHQIFGKYTITIITALRRYDYGKWNTYPHSSSVQVVTTLEAKFDPSWWFLNLWHHFLLHKGVWAWRRKNTEPSVCVVLCVCVCCTLWKTVQQLFLQDDIYLISAASPSRLKLTLFFWF